MAHRASTTAFLWISVLLLFPVCVWAQRGHTIRGNQIFIDTRSHWEGWDIAGGIADISAEGSVQPTFVRKNINAALDAEQFEITGTGGLVAGSNPRDARNLIDGDPNTTWGPNTDSALKDWWVTLNLGRLVVASRIVLRFAEEGMGDPFLQFKVLVWRQQSDTPYVVANTTIPKFREVGRTVSPNKTQRLFEFVPDPTGSTDDVFVGDAIQSVQIIVTSSDLGRAAEITRGEFDALPAGRQGAVDYYRRERSGRETLISRDEYEALAPERMGPIKYYRKEVPKLAEVEVWTVGDNINLGLTERGGSVSFEDNAGPKNLGSALTDGDFTTAYKGSIFGYRAYDFFEDLGALFWVDTMHFLISSAIDEMFVDISDGTRAPDGSIKWTRVASSRASELGTSWINFREIRFESAKVRFVRAPFQNPGTSLNYLRFEEVMLYGEGYVPEVELTSDLMRLGGRKNLISIEWEADTPPGTTVQLETRTGNELEEIKVYHNSGGAIITEKRYNKLPKVKRGEIASTFEPGGDWSTWSNPYRFSGEDVRSPSPREFMLIRARFLGNRPDVSAALRSITVNLSDPLADKLVGEVWPNRIETIARPDTLSFFILPSFTSIRQGFDEILIGATARTTIELLEVRTGLEDDFRNGQFTRFSPSQLVLIDAAADTLWFRLPDPVGREVDLIEVRFLATIFSNSASFFASVQDSKSPGLWQRVDAGDATDLVDSGVTTVLSLAGNDVIKEVDIAPRVMTPNGDRINDQMTFTFSVGRLNGEREVRLMIYDLSGRAIRDLSERRLDPRGAYSRVWSGEDESGHLVPPGIYIARVEVDADSGSATKTSVDRLIYVAY